MTPEPARFYTLEEAQELTGLDKDILREAIKNGQLGALLIGQRNGHDLFKVPGQALLAYAEWVATRSRPSQSTRQRPSPPAPAQRRRPSLTEVV